MANNVNEDDLVVPCKKLRKESSGIDNEDFGSIPSGTSSHFPNTHGVTVFSKTSESEPGRHLRFHSVEQDDVQSSSGNSSNVENDSQNDEDSGNLSDSSSHASSGDWQRRPTGMMGWVQAQMLSGVDPREIIQHLVPSLSSSIPADINPFALWKLILNIMSEPQRRPKLSHINTLSDVVNLIKNAKNILVLTGAGVSVSCGIPDFRSRDGIYARLAVDFPDLPDPQAMFDISYFTQDPRPFFKFAKEIYPGQFKPSRGHRFISLLQKTGRLLRNYTQNIDTLEQVSGISKVIQCHGSFATASCLKCEYKVDCEVVREDIFNMKVPRCPQCPPDEELAIMKPDIVFFGESLPEHFHRQMSKDKHDTDLLIVIGSSLKVRPVALIPSSLPDHVPQILINREPLPHVQFDVELLGDGDTIVAELCKRLGPEFSEIAEERELLEEIDTLPDENSSSPLSQSNSDESITKNNEIKTENENENSSSKPKYETLQSSSANDKNNNSSQDSEKNLPSATDDISCQINLNGSKSEVSSSEGNHTISSAIENREINEHKSSTESSGKHETERDASENDPPTTSNEEKNSPSEAEEVPKKCYNNMWKSRWKQSISKRLPAGTFYYNGKFRYIFPGAEVAPEEVDDDDDSDTSYDDDIGDTIQSSSSSDESEEDVKGPGGLSSTKRDLRSITMRSNHHHHHFHDLTSSCIHDHDDSDEIIVNTQVLSNSTTDEDKKLHNSEADKTHSESESIIPDELHEDIIELSSSTRSHSPLPESLHKILSTEHLHNDKDDTILGKPVTEIPDTAQILDLPSSSLLPPISQDYPIRTNHQNSESENKKSEEDATSLSSRP